MVRIKYGDIPEDFIIARDSFVANEIYPICLQIIDDKTFEVLFIASQDSTETSIYLRLSFAYAEEEKNILMTHPLFINNIAANPEKKKIYEELIADLNNTSNYMTDLDLKENEDHKIFYSCLAMRPINQKSNYIKAIDLMVPRENYVKIGIFFNDMMTYNFDVEQIFVDPTLNGMKFETMSHIKLDSTTWDENLGYAHYTCGCGPSMYKFTFIFPREKGKAMRNHISMEAFETFYGNDPIVIANEIIYDKNKDAIYVVHRSLNSLNQEVIKTTALIMPKDIYDHSNLFDLYKIYINKKEN